MKLHVSEIAAALGFALAAGCTAQTVRPPFAPVATVDELMESVIAHAAEVYWQSVSVVVDANGINEFYPEGDEEWEEVWAAAMSIAESGNLLMMAPRAMDQSEWMQMAAALVDAGSLAAEAALSQDPDAVLDAGEQVYNACLECHTRYVAQQ
jgi:hypothetical protein